MGPVVFVYPLPATLATCLGMDNTVATMLPLPASVLSGLQVSWFPSYLPAQLYIALGSTHTCPAHTFPTLLPTTLPHYAFPYAHYHFTTCYTPATAHTRTTHAPALHHHAHYAATRAPHTRTAPLPHATTTCRAHTHTLHHHTWRHGSAFACTRARTAHRTAAHLLPRRCHALRTPRTPFCLLRTPLRIPHAPAHAAHLPRHTYTPPAPHPPTTTTHTCTTYPTHLHHHYPPRTHTPTGPHLPPTCLFLPGW